MLELSRAIWALSTLSNSLNFLLISAFALPVALPYTALMRARTLLISSMPCSALAISFWCITSCVLKVSSSMVPMGMNSWPAFAAERMLASPMYETWQAESMTLVSSPRGTP